MMIMSHQGSPPSPKLSPQDPQSKGQDQLRGNDAKRSAQSTKALFKLCLYKSWKIETFGDFRFRREGCFQLVWDSDFTLTYINFSLMLWKNWDTTAPRLAIQKGEAVEELLSQGCVQ